MTEVAIQVETAIEWVATRSGKMWIAECEALGLATESESLDELHSLIPETCFALFVDLLHDNELHRFLEERGWHAVGVPDDPSLTDVEFDFPWHLIAAEKGLDTKHRPH